MTQQDEGRINPDEPPHSMGISEFVRKEEEQREAQLDKLAEEIDERSARDAEAEFQRRAAELRAQPIDGEFVPDGVDMPDPAGYGDTMPGSMPGDGGTNHAARESRVVSKLRYDLIPSDFLEFLARIFTYGASKYDDNNWMKGLNASELYACATRHMQKWWAGEDLDADDGEQKGSGLPHLWHALWNVGVMAYFERHRPDLDDRGINEPRLVTSIIAGPDNPTFAVEVQLPADDSNEGFIFAQQGGERATIEQARAVLQALREDGYDMRVIRIVRTSDRLVMFTDGSTEVDGLLSVVVQTVFPGDPEVEA